MIDTNTVSYIVKGNSPAARAWLANLPKDEAVCISSITAAEVRFELARRPVSPALHAAVEGFLARIPILSWGRDEALVYGGLRAKQEAAGKPLESMDLLIAAHAISAGARLVTHDAVFRQVQDPFPTVDWATDLKPLR